MSELSRRTFLLASGAGLLAACSSSSESPVGTTVAPTSTSSSVAPTTVAPTTVAPTTSAGAVVTGTTQAPFNTPSPAPFAAGVASGDPRPDRVVLWTRATPAAGSGDVPLRWEVASDDTFRTVVARGEVTALADDDFTVRVDAGGLTPDTRFRFRFLAGTAEVRGTTRTAPAAGAAVRELRFGFGSCQDFQNGYYAAHRDIAAAELDLMVWLGDYIYEYGPRAGAVRAHTGGECTTLADYRARYALYRSDADLQAAHASCPWLVVWDDHEVENNYADAVAEDAGVAPEAFLERRAAAYRAWWEWMPTRLPRPEGASLKIYRDVTWGSLARVFLLDGRQYRSDQACGDAILSTAPPCPEWSTGDRTMLGAEQEAWLLDGLRASTATWNVLGNQVVMGDARLNGAVLNFDQWDGYPQARQRLLTAIRDAGRTNVVAVTGDIHLSAVADVRLDDGTTTVLTEFVGTSIASGALLPPSLEGFIGLFPALKYLNVQQRGWVRNTVTPERWTAEFRAVEDVTKASSPVSTDATFTVTPDRPGAVRA